MSDHQQKLLDLLVANGAKLHALLTRLTLRPDVAEDLLQELFLKLNGSTAWKRCRDADAYAYRAAIHLAFDWHRAQKRRAHEPLRENASAPASSPLAAVIQREEFQEVLDALSQLPEVSRDCLVLRHLEDEAYESIALQLGKTAHQIRALCDKGLVQLRQILGKKHREPDPKEVANDRS